MHCIVCIPSMIRSGSTVVMVVAFEVAGAGAGGAGVSEAIVDCKIGKDEIVLTPNNNLHRTGCIYREKFTDLY